MIDFRKIRAALKELERIHKILKKDKGCHYFDQNYTVNILLDCKSVIGLYSWLRRVNENDMLSGVFENTLKMEEKSIIVPLYLLVYGLCPEERILLVKALMKIAEHGRFHFGYESFKDMYEETDSFHQESEGKVLLFQGTLGSYMAVGRSAELLYEHLGWQFAVNKHDDGCSCMFLCDYSPIVLGKAVEYTISRQELDFDFIHLDAEGEMCLEFSLQQQMMDYYRFMSLGDEIHLPTCGMVNVCVEEDGVRQDLEFPFMEVGEKSISLFNSQAGIYLVVSGHSWMISPEDLHLANRLADLLYMDMSLQDDKSLSFGQRYLLQSSMCANAFYELKEKYEKSVLMVDYQGIVESYGADAVWLAWHYDIPLWCRHDSDVCIGSSPFVVIPAEVVQKVLEKKTDAVLEGTKIQDVEEAMALWPNVLNYGLKDKTEYENPRVYKRKGGSYVVKASLNGKQLPERVLAREMVSAYEMQPDGIMKQAVLKQILWYVYTVGNVKRPNDGNVFDVPSR